MPIFLAMQSETIYIYVADLICKIILENVKYADYFKKKYHYPPSSGSRGMTIHLKESPEEYMLTSSPTKLEMRLKKSSHFSEKDLDSVIRVLIEYSNIKNGLFFLHGSSFIKNGKAFIFVANSGTGKSTILKHVSKKNILSDDVAVLKKHNDKFYVFTSPFDDKKYLGLPQKKVELGKIYFLKQASFNEVVPQEINEKLFSIMYNNMIFFLNLTRKEHKKRIDTKIENKLYDLSLSVIKSTPVETLYFTKDVRINSII